MNIFQLFGDLLHLFSFFIIVYKLHRDKSSVGVSAKAQEIYLLVFLTRYIDLFFRFISLYNTVMKILFISTTIYIIFLIRFTEIKKTYDRVKNDPCRHEFIPIVALFPALLVNRGWSPLQFLVSYSLWLESIAIIPQITILARDNGAEKFIAHYLAALGSYRFFYVVLWVYRYVTMKFLLWDAVLAGIVQVLLYSDFFYLYLKNVKNTFISDLPLSNAKPQGFDKKDDDDKRMF
ncbi:MAG: ER lumen protein-retaining receptor [archaeon]|nr:ER lumen protein-retaining receptor [archaeon]